jgi:hypothetical protein
MNTCLGNQAGEYTVTGGYNTYVGSRAGAQECSSGVETTGTCNVCLGFDAGLGVNAVSKYEYNTLLGSRSGYGTTTGSNNVCVGYSAGYSNTTGYRNVYMGTNAGLARKTDLGSVAVGYNAGTGSDGVVTDLNMTAVGYQALMGLTTGTSNCALGFRCGELITTAINSTLLGSYCGALLTTSAASSNNTCVGTDCMRYVNASTGNVYVGCQSGQGNADGATSTGSNYNTGVGMYALYAVETGDNNVCVGYSAGKLVTTGTSNVAVGHSAADSVTTGSANVCIGALSGEFLTTEANNTLVGHAAGRALTSAANTCVGYMAGVTMAAGTITSCGFMAGYYATGTYNTFMGYQAGYGVVAGFSGTGNTAVGHLAGTLMTGAVNYNTILGYDAMGEAAITGPNNTAVGAYAFKNATSGSNNVVVGHNALTYGTTASSNVFVGVQTAGGGIATCTGSTVVGYCAGHLVNSNVITAVGYSSCFNCVSGAGDRNTAVGTNSCYYGIGDDCVAVGDSALLLEGSTVIGGGTPGTNSATNCVAVGSWAMRYCRKNQDCVAIGKNAYRYGGYGSVVSPARNIAIGTDALSGQGITQALSNVNSDNIAIGYHAGWTICGATAITGANVLVGNYAGSALTTGVNNSLVGHNAGLTLATGGSNVIMGASAGGSAVSSSNLVLIGASAAPLITTSSCTVIGTSAASDLSSGANHTVIGYAAGQRIDSFGNDTFVGDGAGRYVNGGQNTMVGSACGLGVDGVSLGCHYNTAMGYQAMYAITTGNYNCAFGHQCGLALTTGDENTFVGRISGMVSATDNANTYVGYAAGEYIESGSNVAVGRGAMSGQSASHATGPYNVAVGCQALSDVTTGTENVAVGYYAGNNLTTSTRNVILGPYAADLNAMAINTTTETTGMGYGSVIIGYKAGHTVTSNVVTAIGYQSCYNANTTTGDNVTAVGYNTNYWGRGNHSVAVGAYAMALEGLNSGAGTSTNPAINAASTCVAVGSQAMRYARNNTDCIAIGANALLNNGYSVQTPVRNIGIGSNALKGVSTAAPNTQSDNIGIGYNSGQLIGTSTGTNAANYNVMVGNYTGAALTTAANNCFFGHNAGLALTTGGGNCIFGSDSGKGAMTGNYNSIFGQGSGIGITSGQYNVIIGPNAGVSMTTAEANVCIGTASGNALTLQATCSYNTMVGINSGRTTVGGSNVFIGYDAAANSTTTQRSTVIGFQANGMGVMTGDDNVMVGNKAGERLSSGASNVLVGVDAANGLTTGNNNVCLGYYSGRADDTTTSTNMVTCSSLTLLGYNTGVTLNGITNATALGANANVSASNSCILGGPSQRPVENTAGKIFQLAAVGATISSSSTGTTGVTLSVTQWTQGILDMMCTATSLVKTNSGDLIVNGVFRPAFTPQIGHTIRLLVYAGASAINVTPGSSTVTSTSQNQNVTIKGANSIAAYSTAYLYARIANVGTNTTTTFTSGTNGNLVDVYIV